MPSSLTTLLPPGLRILSSSTCVGLRYGPLLHDGGFSTGGAAASLLHFAPASRFRLMQGGFSNPATTSLARAFHSRLCFLPRVPAVLITRVRNLKPAVHRIRISASLGPDLPRADQLYSGNLGYSAARILTLLSLLIPAFSLLSSPHPLPVMLRSPKNAPLPTLTGSAASVWCFSPGHFRRRTSRPVSCYALF